MKTHIVAFALIAGTLLGHAAHAQVSLQVNIGVQPIWGPTGYDHVDYYYIPDVDAYYDVNAGMYTYMDGGMWVTRPALFPRYANFDLYNAHKVVLNERTPWMHESMYRTRYARYRGMHDQHPIRDSHDQKYFANPGHPHHNEWHGAQSGPRGAVNHGPANRGPENHGQQNHGPAPMNQGPQNHGQQNHGPAPANHGPENHGPAPAGHGPENHGPENHGGGEHGGGDHGHEEHR